MLDAASRLFATRHFHAVRMDDIAAEAEVAKGTLYSYFEDKEALYLALLTRASGQFATRLREATNRARDPRARLEAIVAFIVAYFDEQPHLLDLIQRAEVLSDSGVTFPWQPTRAEVLRLVLDLFEEARAAGAFAVRDPDLAVLMLLGGLRSVIRLGPRPRPADLARRLVENFLHGADTTRDS